MTKLKFALATAGVLALGIVSVNAMAQAITGKVVVGRPGHVTLKKTILGKFAQCDGFHADIYNGSSYLVYVSIQGETYSLGSGRDLPIDVDGIYDCNSWLDDVIIYYIDDYDNRVVIFDGSLQNGQTKTIGDSLKKKPFVKI